MTGSAAVDPLAGLPWAAGMTVTDAAGTPCLQVPPERWLPTVQAACTGGFDFLDWLTAVDEPQADPPTVDVVVHLVGLQPLRRLLLRTRLVPDGGRLRLASITGLLPGAAWHERETFEMFGVEFDAFDDGTGLGLRPLLLPDGFEGTPLRKSFVLAARATRAWPGAKEPGESGDGHAAPSRRKLLPPGVPDPLAWGPRDPGTPAQQPAAQQPAGRQTAARAGRAGRATGRDPGA